MARVKLTLSIDEDIVKKMKVDAIYSGESISETTEKMWTKRLWGDVGAIVREEQRKEAKAQ